ncbi:hypothetical protein [Cryptosporangium sp. NPDC051539]|uniref:hypothetical protein n=1 Tax=Cryptosporangium sp. NPDC051539 TaxID=3363962 RepID=UPI00379AB3E3
MSPFVSDHRRRWPWLVGAIVLVLATAVGIAVAVRPWSGPAPARAAVRLPAVGLPPGLTAAQAQKILDTCLNTRAKQQATDAKLFNAVVTGYATDALIYSGRWAVGCQINPMGSGGMTTMPLPGDVRWLDGPLSVDLTDGKDSRPWMKQPGFDVIGGRVPPGVRKVTVDLHGKTYPIAVVNGTYLARIPRDRLYRDEHGEEPARKVIRAFDANGKLVGTYETGYRARHCVVTPDGERLDRDPQYPKPCVTAASWV